MPFKIVQTIEDEDICLTIVPSQWEKNGILYWPPKKSIISKIAKNEHLNPDNTWEKLLCVNKRKIIKTFESAQEQLIQMESKSDTEEGNENDLELQDFASPSLEQNRSKRIKKKMSTQLMDFNHYVPKNQLLTDRSLSESVTSPMMMIISNNDTDEETFTGSIPSDSNNLPDNAEFNIIEENLASDISEASHTLVENNNFSSAVNLMDILKNQHLILDNQQKIENRLIKNEASLEALVKTINNTFLLPLNGGAILETTGLAKNSNFKCDIIGSEADFKKLEENLKDVHYFNDAVDSMSFVCGKSGKDNGVDCCYKLVDYFLSRDFLTQCSWTGNSRVENNQKTALKFYINFRRLFLKIVRLADTNFSEAECDKFFKRVIKNSQKRKDSKITSAHKRRRKNGSSNKNENPEVDLSSKTDINSEQT